MDLFQDIKDFHEKFGLNYDGPPRALPIDLLIFREKFLQEELDEYKDAGALVAMPGSHVNKPAGLEKQLDGLVDLVYVAVGTAYLHGFDFNEAWKRVHAANMAKVRKLSANQPTEDSGRQPTYDVVKPEGWVAPDLSDLV